ncbi:unnamed protein product, partial [Prorocentrum cordatum]
FFLRASLVFPAAPRGPPRAWRGGGGKQQMCPGVPAAADALGPTAAPRPDARLEGMAAATAGAGGALPCAVPAPLDEDYFALGAGGAAPAAASGASPRVAALPRADAHEPESAAEGAAGCASEAPAPQPPGAAAQEAVPAGEAARTYGGRFTWVGAEYRLRVAAGLSPLQCLQNIATNSILSLDSLCFSEDGGFHRPGAEEPAFPVGGVDLRWRYDPASARIVIDFFKPRGAAALALGRAAAVPRPALPKHRAGPLRHRPRGQAHLPLRHAERGGRGAPERRRGEGLRAGRRAPPLCASRPKVWASRLSGSEPCREGRARARRLPSATLLSAAAVGVGQHLLLGTVPLLSVPISGVQIFPFFFLRGVRRARARGGRSRRAAQARRQGHSAATRRPYIFLRRTLRPRSIFLPL